MPQLATTCTYWNNLQNTQNKHDLCILKQNRLKKLQKQNSVDFSTVKKFWFVFWTVERFRARMTDYKSINIARKRALSESLSHRFLIHIEFNYCFETPIRVFSDFSWLVFWDTINMEKLFWRNSELSVSLLSFRRFERVLYTIKILLQNFNNITYQRISRPVLIIEQQIAIKIGLNFNLKIKTKNVNCRKKST